MRNSKSSTSQAKGRRCDSGGVGGEQRRAERAHEVPVGVDEDLHPELVLEGAHHPGVLRDAAPEDDRGLDALALGDRALARAGREDAGEGAGAGARAQTSHLIYLSENFLSSLH